MHIYKRELVTSQSTQLVMPADALVACFAIGFPQEGRITRMLLLQSVGAPVELTVDLYDRAVCDALDVVSISGESRSGSVSSLTASSDQMTNAIARIIPTQTVAAGTVMELREGMEDGGPWSYRNREGTFSVPKRFVYIGIGVESNDAGMEFEVALECEVGNETNG